MNLSIEPQAEHHADGLFRALQPAEIYSFLGTSPPSSIKEVRDRIARQNNGPQDGSGSRWLNWIVIVEGQIAGYTQATIAADGTATLAFVISPAFWRRSIGYQACKLTLLALDSIAGVIRVVADAELGNLRSRALLRRLGFDLVHETEIDAYYDGGPIADLVAAYRNSETSA